MLAAYFPPTLEEKSAGWLGVLALADEEIKHNPNNGVAGFLWMLCSWWDRKNGDSLRMKRRWISLNSPLCHLHQVMCFKREQLGVEKNRNQG